MVELIRKDKLFCDFWNRVDPFVETEKVYPQQVWNTAASIVREAKTVDAVPVVHGRWMDKDALGNAYCSNCDKFCNGRITPYCPNCGAKMDGKDQNEVA